MEDFWGPTAKKTDLLQNATKFTAQELADIEDIKVFLEQHLTQEEIAEKLQCHRTTVSRKISKWSQTEDFKQWLTTRWVAQYNKFSNDPDLQVEAFKQLTRFMCANSTRKIEAKTEEKISVDVNVTETTNSLQRYEAALKRALAGQA
jgi:IS30 family transposase